MTAPGWNSVIAPQDWAAMTRMHESTHVTASEALGIPVTDVWANVDPAVAHGGQYRNGPGDSQLQSVVYLIGAEGGARELRERGYDDALAHTSVLAGGHTDREIVRTVVVPEAAAGGWRVDADLAYDSALQVLGSDGFLDTARTVAQAMADRGDRLTGADVRAAVGSYQLSGDLWLPTSYELTLAEREREPAHSPGPIGPAAPDDDLDIDL
ncbi:hypothetical protein [Streptomyces mobaraensis]|uniref:Uncharacterized protein n=1 Tax=Streptomyces mobaraensis TaxID=35621 RepID=A0A5N5VY12_STRMB|nr:hypothetical protein [Streptomyces mobaraensis]KAB7833555.1 hypothetical protein FRZ00_33465 [Streptomyces mobaraensis]